MWTPGLGSLEGSGRRRRAVQISVGQTIFRIDRTRVERLVETYRNDFQSENIPTELSVAARNNRLCIVSRTATRLGVYHKHTGSAEAIAWAGPRTWHCSPR